jgi:O-antigen/teichoic acid export membrane protein
MIRRRLLTGTVSNCIGKVTALGAWFVLTPFVLAELGSDAFALWVLVGAVASYGLLLEHGIGGAIIKYVAEHVARNEHQQARSIVASAVLLYAGFATVAVLAGLILAPLLPPVIGVDPAQQPLAERLIVLTGINVALAIAFTPASAVLRGLQRYDLHNGVVAVNAIVEAAAVAVMLLVGWGLVGMMMALIAANLVTGVGSVVLVARVCPALKLGVRAASMASFRRIALFSTSLFTIEVGRRLQNRADEFIIGAFQALSGVTPYALARKLGELSELIAVQFVKVVLPLASELDAADQARALRKLYVVSSRVTLAISVPVAVILGVLGGQVLTLWVGAEYGQYAPLVAVLALAHLIGTSQWPGMEILQGIARHRLIAVTSLATGVANVVLSVLLLPVLGLIGVALGTLIPIAIASFCVVMPFALRTLAVSVGTAIREIWLPSLVPGLAAAAVAFTLRHGTASPSIAALLMWIAASAVTYGMVYLAMPPCRAERQLLLDLFSRGRLRPLTATPSRVQPGSAV